MSKDADINKIAAEIIAKQYEKIYEFAASGLSKISSHYKARFKIGLRKYLEKTAEYLFNTKSFFSNNEAVYLYDFFVPLDAKRNGKIVKCLTYHKLVSQSRYIILTGLGGCGKTILMRHLAHGAFECNVVPVFIELRKVDIKTKSIFRLVQEQFALHGLSVTDEYLDTALSIGSISIFLDGFDEIDRNYKNTMIEDLRQFEITYNKAAIVLSSRPDDIFKSLQRYIEIKIEPLRLDLAIALVKKLNYDIEIKNKFCAELKSGLFAKHKSFLSNPLLLTIMLLTYLDCASIPNKLSVFYKHAYEAMHTRHDSYKGAFCRVKLTNLDIREFAKIFSLFCLKTYDKRVFEFSKEDALEYISFAKQLTRYDFNVEDYLTDAIQAVCLLVEDGLTITFTHRSFQEYFVAKYICSADHKIQEVLLDKYSFYMNQDAMFKLVWEMDSEVFEKRFIIPLSCRLAKLVDITDTVSFEHYVALIKKTKLVMSTIKSDSQTFVNSWNTTQDGCPATFYCNAIKNLQAYPPYRAPKSQIEEVGFDFAPSIIEKYGVTRDNRYVVESANLLDSSQFFTDLSVLYFVFSFHAFTSFFALVDKLKQTHAEDTATIESIISSH